MQATASHPPVGSSIGGRLQQPAATRPPHWPSALLSVQLPKPLAWLHHDAIPDWRILDGNLSGPRTRGGISLGEGGHAESDPRLFTGDSSGLHPLRLVRLVLPGV